MCLLGYLHTYVSKCVSWATCICVQVCLLGYLHMCPSVSPGLPAYVSKCVFWATCICVQVCLLGYLHMCPSVSPGLPASTHTDAVSLHSCSSLFPSQVYQIKVTMADEQYTIYRRWALYTAVSHGVHVPVCRHSGGDGSR